jgi:hypothetical protein
MTEKDNQKNNVIAILMAFGIPLSIVVGIIFIFFSEMLPGYHINQEIREAKCLCAEDKLVTYVWHNGHIIWSAHDPISTLKDSTRYFRRQEAKEIIKRLKQ